MKSTIYWIQSAQTNHLAIVARPRGGDWLRDEVAALSAEGINVVVSLLTAEEEAQLGLEMERHFCGEAGFDYVGIPIPDRGVPSDENLFRTSVDRVIDLLKRGRSVGVHCRACIGRSSIFVAAVLVGLGFPVDEAFEAIETARGRPVPDTEEQRKWVVERFG